MGGNLRVRSGGSADTVYLKPGGVVEVFSGGRVTHLHDEGGTLLAYEGSVVELTDGE